MDEDIYIKFLFDYDHELGYTEKCRTYIKRPNSKNKWKNIHYFIWSI